MKTILFLFFGLCLSGLSRAQSPHRPLSDFGTDTIRYIRTNFGENKARYIGRPVGLLLDELDVKIVNFVADQTAWDPVEKSGLIKGLDIDYRWDIRSGPPCVFLGIDFEHPYTKDVRLYYDLDDRYGKRWRPEYYDLFKNFIVKDIIIVDPTLWPSWKGTPAANGQ